MNSIWSFKFASSDELQLLVIFSLWWTCFWWHVITLRALCLQEQFSSDAFKLPFCWFLCSLLFFQNLIMISNIFSMVLYTWTNISISNWQFFNTLLSSKLSKDKTHFVPTQAMRYLCRISYVFIPKGATIF